MSDSRLLQTLTEQLSGADPAERQYALDRLSDLAPPGAVGLIVPMLRDGDEDVRVEAMVCLRDLRDASAIPHLIAAVDDAQSDRLLEYAIQSLSGFTGPDVRACLLRVITSGRPSNVARMKVVIQLWRYADDEVVAVLKNAVLTDDDRNVRSHAADSLAFLFRTLDQPREWAPFWHQVADDPEFGVSRFGEEALRRLGVRPPPETKQ